jgi:type I restriction enzyme S subunit
VGEPDSGPFDLPSHWRWASLGQLAHPQAGFAFKSSGFNETGDGLPLIRIRDVGQRFSCTYYSGEYRDEFLVSRGDYLISMDGEFRVSEWTHDEALLNQRVTRLQFFEGSVNRRYIAMSLQCRLRELQGVKTYTTVDHLSGGQIATALIGVPPLEEQHRIVAKVDELIALCDRLEARQQDAEAAHARLVQALLDSLTQARNADEFHACWQRLEGQFSDLATTDASLDALRATVLELAFQGRLTADGRNEPWQRVKLGSVAKLINGDRGSNYPNRSEYVSEGIAFINTGHINPDGSLDLDAMHYLPREKFESLRSGKIEPDDLVYCLRGATLGKTAFVRPFTEGAIASSLVILRFAKVVLPEFAYYFLVSPQGRRWIWKYDNGSAQPNLAASSVREYEMPLPSLDEQRQVVSRVTELLALCDPLKARIAAARAKHAQLAEALVSQAVAA